MRLTKHTDYAFRVLIFLAAKEADQLVTIKEATEAFDISRDHVMKVVQKLAKFGFIQAIRGKNGGMRLGKAAEQINLKDIVTLMETTQEPVNCDDKPCLIKPGCHLRTILFDAQNQFFEHLAKFTLADICASDSQTVYILNQVEQHAR